MEKYTSFVHISDPKYKDSKTDSLVATLIMLGSNKIDKSGFCRLFYKRNKIKTVVRPLSRRGEDNESRRRVTRGVYCYDE